MLKFMLACFLLSIGFLFAAGAFWPAVLSFTMAMVAPLAYLAWHWLFKPLSRP